LYRKHGISNATFYKWRSKLGGMGISLMARIKGLEEENRRLKKMYVEERLMAEIVAAALTKKCKRHLIGGKWRNGLWHSGRPQLAWHARHLASHRPATAIAKLDAENLLIADWLVRGFGLCFLCPCRLISTFSSSKNG